MPALLIGACSLSSAQSSPERDRLEEALAGLRRLPSLHLQTTGTTDLGGRTTSSRVVAHWEPLLHGGRELQRLEVQIFSEGLLSRRLLADGIHFWDYNFHHRTYKVARYGTYSGELPERYRDTLFFLFNSATANETNYLIRFIQAVHGSALDVRVPNWLPGAPMHTPAFSMSSVQQVLGDGPRRSFLFHIEPDPADSDVLMFLGITYMDVRPRARLAHRTDWTLTLLPVPTPDPNRFLPYSYTMLEGWRPLVTTELNRVPQRG